MIILHQYPPSNQLPNPACPSSTAINVILVQFFFPQIYAVPLIILLSVMFPHLQSIASTANSKKGDQSVVQQTEI